MLENYLKIAWRHILKSKFHSGINILGLSIGIGFTMLIGAYVWSELQVNKGLRHTNRQYIVQSNLNYPNTGFYLTTVEPPAKALKEQYSEIQLKKAAQIALILALVIVMLGISGLTSLSVQKPTKEIGIRKIVGASSSNIISLFLKDFVPVVIIGGFVSIPIAWYIMQEWLNDYAQRVSISFVPFVISIGAIGFIASLLISLQTARISIENPVKNLRTE